MLTLAFVLSLSVAIAAAVIPPPTVRWYNQTLDHFNFYTSPATFPQRYFIDTSFHKPGGPCFFYTGNEGPLEEFYFNTGFPFDHAQELGALVVFAEHRYYGGSRPFGDSPTHVQLGWLNVEQALADYAEIIEHLFNEFGTMPIISIGGSYGGMLSAWFRIKYPHLVSMALAASAPLRMVSQLVPESAYFEAVTGTFQAADARCPDAVRGAFADLLALAAQGEAGLASLTKTFRLCNPLQASDVQHLWLWVTNAFVSLAMCDYPYPTNFLAPLPAFPVKVACNSILESADPLQGLAAAAGLFFNGTDGNLTCFDIYAEYIECSDPTGCGTGPDGTAWDFQACTEITYAPNTNNVTDMFPPRTWNMDMLADYCRRSYGISPRPLWMLTAFGGGNISSSVTKIIFSNGMLDPWRAGGFMTSLSPSLPAIVIADGAHHLDLRSADPRDPQSVVAARQQEMAYIKQWLLELSAHK